MMVRVSDFSKEVVNASFAQPVLAVFTASWCKPCAQLEPRLMQLSQESKHQWILAEIDADKNQELLAQFQIGYLPSGRLYYNGVPMDEFVGALTDEQLRKWLNDILPPDSLIKLKTAKDFISKLDWNNAISILEPLAEAEHQNEEIKILLAECYTFQKPNKTEVLTDTIPKQSSFYARSLVLKTLAQIVQLVDNPKQLPEARAKEQFLCACNLLRNSDFKGAITQFIEVMRYDMHFYLEQSKKAGHAIFEYLGWQHPLTECQYRIFVHTASRLSLNLYDKWF
jgi:putative thioredoxin